MLATAVTLSLAVIAAIVSALQLSIFGVQQRSRTGPVIDLVVERGSFIWSVHNPGPSEVILKTVVASLAPPGTPHRSLLPVGAALDDIAIRPGRTRRFTRAVPAGPGSLFLVSRFELADGSGGSAWASFTMSVAPGSYDKKEEGVAYY
ncbi:hypothetical protein [Sphingomonas sp. BK580]|uniref:hypothetical protein n=1 Tax=Sphingomonas sp. BK580 TaxID=2586972 RepID=UPI0016196DEE|nr:hypothetical protein [Sphingomonas sp. BK580]MBB3693542.1 hypothetical protein [Sphingomonas sp. BK580]